MNFNLNFSLIVILIPILPFIQSADIYKGHENLLNGKSNYLHGSSSYPFNKDVNYPAVNEDVRFYCVKHDSDTFQQTFIDDKLIGDKINLKQKIGIVVHGWLDGFNDNTTASADWMRWLAIDWSKNSERTVCAVDWKRLADYRYLTTISNHTVIVADHVTELIRILKKKGVPLKHISLTGHGIGSHICGLIGNKLNGELGSIYGLDPSSVGYTDPIDFGENIRLTGKSAKYVQILHTSSDSIGVNVRCGSADYWANSGTDQPGCSHAICNHYRAVDLFKSATNKDRSFPAKDCTDYFEYQFSILLLSIAKQCPSGVVDRYGIWSGDYSGNFYFQTTDKYPFTF